MLRFSAIILILGITHVLSQEERVDQDRPCGPHMFKGMDRCCLLPQLIPFETFEPCFEKEEDAKQEVAAQTKGRKRGKKARAKGGRMCLVQCGMKNQNLLLADGQVNTSAIAERLIAVAEPHWDVLVPETIANCTTEFAKLDLSGIEPREDKNGNECKPGPSLFLSCINHHLSSECPSNALGSIDPLCPERMTYLKKCSPFSLVEGWKRMESPSGSETAPLVKKGKHMGKAKKSGKNKKNKATTTKKN